MEFVEHLRSSYLSGAGAGVGAGAGAAVQVLWCRCWGAGAAVQVLVSYVLDILLLPLQ